MLIFHQVHTDISRATAGSLNWGITETQSHSCSQRSGKKRLKIFRQKLNSFYGLYFNYLSFHSRIWNPLVFHYS